MTNLPLSNLKPLLVNIHLYLNMEFTNYSLYLSRLIMTTSKSILHTLAYFDVFKHPLRVEEILAYLPIQEGEHSILLQLEDLIEKKQVFEHLQYYSLSNDKTYISDRIKFEKNADKAIPNAVKYGNLIRKFPFVKGVMISGSLSKHIMKDDDDIDFFIVSAKNRIWLCKTFLKLYKVFYLKNSYDFFCINYFISEANLHIKEQNTYTATELKTLIPLGCNHLHKELMHSNLWANTFLPNFISNREIKVAETIKKFALSTFFEKIFYGKFGLAFDFLLMNFNKLRNSVKYRKIKKEKDYQLRLRSTMEQIKVHADNQQINTMKALEERKKSLELRQTR